MNLTKPQIRTLAEVNGAGRAVRVWRSRYGADWTWRVNDRPISQSVDNLIRAGCLVVNDNAATVTDFGRTVLKERGAAV